MERKSKGCELKFESRVFEENKEKVVLLYFILSSYGIRLHLVACQYRDDDSIKTIPPATSVTHEYMPVHKKRATDEMNFYFTWAVHSAEDEDSVIYFILFRIGIRSLIDSDV